MPVLRTSITAVATALLCCLATTVDAAAPDPGEEVISEIVAAGFAPPGLPPARGVEASGPYTRLVIRNATVIDGTGAPAVGGVSIVIEGDRIVQVKGGGVASMPTGATEESTPGTRVIDATGQYVLPGFIDAHAHLGTPTHALTGGKVTDPEYVLKLWLAHGVTMVRDVGAFMGLKWMLDLRRRSELNQISAPRMVVFSAFPADISTPEAARTWLRTVRKQGADGVKLFAGAPDVIRATIDEAHKLGMRVAFHHAQLAVTRINALDSARMGLDSLEHWYGLPEAMFEDRRVQHYPNDYLFTNEQDRFGEAGRLWEQSAAPGSEKWTSTIDELIKLNLTLSPTFTVYDANRDTLRARTQEWLDGYSMPYMSKSFEPSHKVHGSYFFDWTTADEIAWKNNYRRWMTFVNDYKNAGGRVVTGSDSGFIYSVYGFGYVRELEMLQEAGFHPLEVIRAATLNGAELLGVDKQTGTIAAGKKADLIIVQENPLANFKVLYGTGNPRLNEATDKVERTRGIRYTIKDGVVYDAPMLLEQVRALVAKEKERAAAAKAQ